MNWSGWTVVAKDLNFLTDGGENIHVIPSQNSANNLPLTHQIAKHIYVDRACINDEYICIIPGAL